MNTLLVISSNPIYSLAGAAVKKLDTRRLPAAVTADFSSGAVTIDQPGVLLPFLPRASDGGEYPRDHRSTAKIRMAVKIRKTG